MKAEDFATVDDAVLTTSSTLTDEEIWQEFTQTKNDEVEEFKDNDEELVAPNTTAVETIEIIEKYFSI